MTAVGELAARGQGWVNLTPDVDPDDVPPVPSSLGRLFSGRGPAVPFGTFVAGRKGKPGMIGIEHGTGPRAVTRLREAGVTLPQDWQVKADHARRGLVVAVPAGAGPDAIVDFLLRAASVLSTVPTGDDWLAEVHTS